MTDQEMRDRLFPILGVYGDWIVDHGRKLDKSDNLAQNIMSSYQMFHDRTEPAITAVLMSSIDAFCRERNYPPPADHVEHCR